MHATVDAERQRRSAWQNSSKVNALVLVHLLYQCTVESAFENVCRSTATALGGSHSAKSPATRASVSSLPHAHQASSHGTSCGEEREGGREGGRERERERERERTHRHVAATDAVGVCPCWYLCSVSVSALISMRDLLEAAHKGPKRGVVVAITRGALPHRLPKLRSAPGALFRIWRYVCMNALHACMHVCMHACMCVCMYVCIHTYRFSLYLSSLLSLFVSLSLLIYFYTYINTAHTHTHTHLEAAERQGERQGHPFPQFLG